MKILKFQYGDWIIAKFENLEPIFQVYRQWEQWLLPAGTLSTASYKEHACQVSSNLAKRYWRRSFK